MTLSFQTIGLQVPGPLAEEDPVRGLEQTLQLIAYAEALGYHAIWLPQRQLGPGLSSAVTLLAAASQRTRRIDLGAEIQPPGQEAASRLAEDLATVDLLSHGRLNVGLRGADAAKTFAQALRPAPLSDAGGAAVLRLHPVAKGIEHRLWHDIDRLEAAEWAGRNGWHGLAGSSLMAEGAEDFFAAQTRLIESHRAAWTAPHAPRLALGRVILPLDNANWTQRRRYHDHAAWQNTRSPGAPGQLFAPVITGTSNDILHELARDPLALVAQELRIELPQGFPHEDIVQIIEDLSRLLPILRSWAPTHAAISA